MASTNVPSGNLTTTGDLTTGNLTTTGDLTTGNLSTTGDFTTDNLTTSVSPFTTVAPPPAVLHSFNGTCVPTQFPCYPGTRYIDPCDCSFYYVCRDAVSIVRQKCASRTAYDHTKNKAYCSWSKDIVGKGKCQLETPWARCHDRHPSANLGKLQRWCSSSGYFTQDTSRKGGDGGSDIGAIFGIIFLLLVIVLAVVGIVIYVRKKGNPIPRIKKSRFWKEVVRREGREPRYNEERDESEAGSRRSDSPRYDDTAADGAASAGVDLDWGHQHQDSHVHAEYSTMDPDRHSFHSEEGYRQEEKGGAVGGYDNPAMESDTPPPDTEYSPAPPAYSEDEHYRARELNEMDQDTAQFHATMDDDGFALQDQNKLPHRDHSPPRLSLSARGDDSPLNRSFTA